LLVYYSQSTGVIVYRISIGAQKLIKEVLDKANRVFHEYSPQFWVLSGASFIDSLGKTILFPFFTLYITRRFGIGMAQAGILLGIFSVSGMFGGLLGGALADKAGRKVMILAGLLLSAGSSLFMGFISDLKFFYAAAVIVGLFSEAGDPARQAMIADLLPEEKRAEGFGVFRVVHNLAWVIGPSVGGFLASKSYMYLFFTDAVMSSITAIVVFRFIQDTTPVEKLKKKKESFSQTLGGYKLILKNRVFVAYLLVSIVMLLVYQQLYSTFSVFLRDYRGFPESSYGFVMSINAAIVVLFQFWISRRVSKRNPFLMLALGTSLYLFGFTAFGFFYSFYLILIAVIVITIGEMVMVPVQMAVVARLAPEDMRGRYMAGAGFSWSIPAIIGPWAAGMVLDNFDPNLVWKLCGLFAVIAAAGYYALYLNNRKEPAAEK